VKLLGFETSTDACSAALWVDGEAIEEYRVAPRAHAELILAMADRVLATAGLRVGDLDGVAFGRGPGAFTGVRIAAGVTQGVAFAAGLPVVPVPTLQALAQGVWRERGEEAVLVALDARMGEVYWGVYRLGPARLMEPVVAERICVPERVPPVPAVPARWLGAGSGWTAYGDQLAAALGDGVAAREPGHYPHARDVVTLAAPRLAAGETVPAEDAVPVYLRDRVTGV
jgi:tRNA threonylcarbamoyladenosine biosynthesis protein TsaB